MTEEPTFSAREEEMEEEEEEEEQALIGKEDLALRVDGTSSRERLMGITARVGGTTRPWYSKSLKRNEKQDIRQGSQNISTHKKTKDWNQHKQLHLCEDAATAFFFFF